jgi:hypothetical protein
VRTSAVRLCLRKISTGTKDRFEKHLTDHILHGLNEINRLTQTANPGVRRSNLFGRAKFQ